jgi:hypothetical protein
MPPLPTILLILAALSTGATVIAILVAIRSGREAKSAIFPIVREEETVKARRARLSTFIWLAATALFLGGWLAAQRLNPAGPIPTAETAQVSPVSPTAAMDAPPPTTQPAPTQAPPVVDQPTLPPAPAADTPAPLAPSATPLPPTATATQTPEPPTATPAPTNTATATITPTPTPTATPTPVRLGPASSRTPAPTGVKMGPIQFSADVTDDFEAVNPAKVFSRGTSLVYAVYPFSGMQKGLEFTTVWYKNGVELGRETTPWEYGETAASFNFITITGPGLYKLELWVNDTVVATNMFEIE